MSQLGSYDYPRARGEHENDVTSFLPEQKSWNLGDDREAWHDILHCFVYQGYALPDYDPGFMYDEGQIVIDLENRPIKNWREIPLTCSSELEGMTMEITCRLNPFISSSDFRARMPRTRLRHGAARAQYASSTINMHKTRFRQQAGLSSWLRKAGTLETRQYLETIIPQHMVTANWTKGWAGPTKAQQKHLQILSRGQYPERATGRNVSPTTRAQRDAIEARRLARLEAKEAAELQPVDPLQNQPPTTPLILDDLQVRSAVARFSTTDIDTLSDGHELSAAIIESVLQKIKSPQAYIVGSTERVAHADGSMSAQNLIPVDTVDFTVIRIVVIPIWVRDHWTLAVIDFIDEDVRILDSSNNLEAIAWAFVSTQSITASFTHPNGWPLREIFSAEHANQHDSGLWVLANAEAIFKGELLPESIDIGATRARYCSLIANHPTSQQRDGQALPMRQSRKREPSVVDDMDLDYVIPIPRKRRAFAPEELHGDSGINCEFSQKIPNDFIIGDSNYQSPYPKFVNFGIKAGQLSQLTDTVEMTLDLSPACLDEEAYWAGMRKLHDESLAFLEETEAHISQSRAESVENNDFADI